MPLLATWLRRSVARCSVTPRSITRRATSAATGVSVCRSTPPAEPADVSDHDVLHAGRGVQSGQTGAKARPVKCRAGHTVVYVLADDLDAEGCRGLPTNPPLAGDGWALAICTRLGTGRAQVDDRAV